MHIHTLRGPRSVVFPMLRREILHAVVSTLLFFNRQPPKAAALRAIEKFQTSHTLDRTTAVARCYGPPHRLDANLCAPPRLGTTTETRRISPESLVKLLTAVNATEPKAGCAAAACCWLVQNKQRRGARRQQETEISEQLSPQCCCRYEDDDATMAESRLGGKPYEMPQVHRGSGL